MLAPNQRQHLLQVLRPPEGYELAFAIGTTYSLDLMALLSVPLAFAQFDWEDDAGHPAADPLALLEALRRYADRLHIFCQAGCITVAPKNQLLFGYLEESVIQVQAPYGGVFHPKIWVLRFTSPDGPVIYRLLCLSRNLTFDASWDTLLMLEGEVVERQKAYSINHPLGDFIKALPSLANEKVPEHILANIAVAQKELRRVAFERPDDFDEVRFWPIGIDGYRRRWPFQANIDRLLVVSPFLSPDCLHWLNEQGSNNVLMSRLDSLSVLRQADLDGFKQVFSLSEMAEIEEPHSKTTEDLFLESPCSGLHAKLYVADRGRRAHMWTGSANATSAAFQQNVEFLVELIGWKSRVGVEVFLGKTKERSGFADLWEIYDPSSDTVQTDTVQLQLEKRLRSAQTTLISCQWHGRVDLGAKSDGYLLRIWPENPCNMPSEIKMLYWPLSLSDASAYLYDRNNSASAAFGPMALESITSFFVFQISTSIEDRSMVAQFILRVPLEGIPEDRQERLLRALLKNQEQVLRFLLLILADGKEDIGGSPTSLLDTLTSEYAGEVYKYHTEKPLFELLVQALHRDPSRLDQIARTIADLERTTEGSALIPDGLHSIWLPIWEARQRLL